MQALREKQAKLLQEFVYHLLYTYPVISSYSNIL